MAYRPGELSTRMVPPLRCNRQERLQIHELDPPVAIEAHGESVACGHGPRLLPYADVVELVGPVLVRCTDCPRA